LPAHALLVAVALGRHVFRVAAFVFVPAVLALLSLDPVRCNPLQAGNLLIEKLGQRERCEHNISHTPTCKPLLLAVDNMDNPQHEDWHKDVQHMRSQPKKQAEAQ
jgi:hypothetical protein